MARKIIPNPYGIKDYGDLVKEAIKQGARIRAYHGIEPEDKTIEYHCQECGDKLGKVYFIISDRAIALHDFSLKLCEPCQEDILIKAKGDRDIFQEIDPKKRRVR